MSWWLVWQRWWMAKNDRTGLGYACEVKKVQKVEKYGWWRLKSTSDQAFCPIFDEISPPSGHLLIKIRFEGVKWWVKVVLNVFKKEKAFFHQKGGAGWVFLSFLVIFGSLAKSPPAVNPAPYLYFEAVRDEGALWHFVHEGEIILYHTSKSRRWESNNLERSKFWDFWISPSHLQGNWFNSIFSSQILFNHYCGGPLQAQTRLKQFWRWNGWKFKNLVKK